MAKKDEALNMLGAHHYIDSKDVIPLGEIDK